MAVGEWWLEQAKYHFSRLEFAEAIAALQRVTAQPSEPFLDVEKAALLYELGEFQQASSIAAAAVDRIRKQSDPDGWSLRALGEEASALDVTTASLAAHGAYAAAFNLGYARRRELSQSGADPREALAELASELGASRGPVEATRKTFDPGAWRTTVSYRYNNLHLRPYQYLRAVDVSAQLPSHHRDDVMVAVAGVVRERPGWAFVHLVVLNAELESIFSRSEVLALSAGQVASLWRRCVTYLNGFAEKLSGARRRAGNLHFNAFKLSMDLLSRLTVRADVSMRQECLLLACRLHESRELRTHWVLHEGFVDLFRRLFAAMGFDEQANALSQIVALSIPTSDDVVLHRQFWRDPSGFVGALGDRLVPLQNSLVEVISRLSVALRGDDELARSVAVSRFDALERAGGLSEDSRRAFVEALWVHADEDGGVPDIEGFSLHLGLLVSAGLPDAKDRFRRWALAARLPTLFVEADDMPGRPRQSQSPWASRHVSALTRATRFPWSGRSYADSLVEWDADEAASLLATMSDWLDDVRQAVLGEKAARLQERSADVVDEVGDFVATVLMPSLRLSDPDVRARVLRFDETLRELARPRLLGRPIWQLMDPTVDVAVPLRAKLVSTRDETVRDAFAELHMWMRFAESGLLPAPVDDVVEQLFALASLARGRALSSAFATVYSVCDAQFSVLTGSRRGWIQVGLERTLRIGAAANDESVASSDNRTAAARLVTLLSLREPSNSLWAEFRSIATADPDPEVRRACEEVADQLARRPDGHG